MKNLILVGLPIGNLKDITLRAKEALESGKFFLAEDTRVFKHLLNSLQISLEDKTIISFHDHTDQKKFEKFFEILEHHDLYLVSDAGSPIISDPAFPFVRSCIEREIKIQTISGVSSVIASLELSGLPPIPFHFHGFPARDEKFKFLNSFYGTHIFFEGGSRILSTLEKIATENPQAEISVCREMTKMFETVYRFNASEFKEQKIDERGEFVIAVYIKEKSNLASNKLREIALETLEAGGKKKQIAKLIAEILNLTPKEVYEKLHD